MNRIAKWTGGTVTALVLALGGVALASGVLDGGDRAEAQDVAATIPVDESALEASPEDIAGGAASDPEMVSNPVVQPVPEGKEPPAKAPKKKKKEEAFVVKRILPIDGPIKYGEWHWDDEGVPDGPLVMTVDLDARVLSVFRGGYEIGATAVLLGTQDHPTPLGTFPILTKEKDNISEKYNNTPMPYTLRLTWDGIAIHGSPVENGYASHGCVGAPNDFAAKLFAIAKKGDKVIITRGETMGLGDSII